MTLRDEHDRYDDEQDRREGRQGITEREQRHDNHLEWLDRMREKGDRARLGLFDENRVRALQRPRSGQVEVQPLHCPVDEAA